jgi:hypothetical protein
MPWSARRNEKFGGKDTSWIITHLNWQSSLQLQNENRAL